MDWLILEELGRTDMKDKKALKLTCYYWCLGSMLGDLIIPGRLLEHQFGYGIIYHP